MWFGFRLILALIGFVIRRFRRKRKFDREFEGVPYWESISRNKYGVTGFALGMPRRSPAWLRLHTESAVDRWVKRMGFSKEIQTGDRRFDRLVYVTSDHPFVEKTLMASAELRQAICDVLEQGYDHVRFDGRCVVIERDSEREPWPGDFELLKRLHAASERLEAGVPSSFADPFLLKALIVEGIIWSLFGYSVGAYLHHGFEPQDVHVSSHDVTAWGLVLAVALFVALVASIWLVLRGSSRGHRIIVESALVLFVALPVAATQIVADTNRALDFSPPERVSAVVHECKASGRRSTTYHLKVTLESATEFPLLTIRVTQNLCYAATLNKRAELWIGPGRWSLPWFRRITIGSETWEPSF